MHQCPPKASSNHQKVLQGSSQDWNLNYIFRVLLLCLYFYTWNIFWYLKVLVFCFQFLSTSLTTEKIREFFRQVKCFPFSLSSSSL